MINIYRSRESVDREKFIYESIAGSDENKLSERTIVIVPDQYTLAAERQAMDRLNTSVLFDIEITGVSNLGPKLMQDTGIKSDTVINKYGRHMLISSILRELDEDLIAFKGYHRRESFIEAVNDFISASKQHEITPDDLRALALKSKDNISLGAFSRKLHDLALIFKAYEERLLGKYTDNEDLLGLFTEAAAKSNRIKNSRIWVYGFDSFTPKNMNFIMALAGQAREVNISLAYDEFCPDEDLFILSKETADRFISKAGDLGIDVCLLNIGDEYKWENKRAGIKAIERNLFSVTGNKELDSQGVKIVKCLNPHNEAEAAAGEVLRLLREEGYRLRDIVLICNDQEVRSSIITRVFREYGLDIFDDQKVNVISTPIAVYLLSLVQILAQGYRTEDVMRFLKTGLTDISEEDIEELENYALKYGIKYSMWEREFTRGAHEEIYSDGGLEKVEGIRRKLMEVIKQYKSLYDKSKSYRDFSEGLMKLLPGEEDNVRDEIEALLSQLAEIMSDDTFDGAEYMELLRSGLSQVEVGILPPTVDDILLGTMQRTRSGDIKACLVTGANDGIIPRIASEDVLFSREELDSLAEEDKELGLSVDLRIKEENLAIYRALSRPSEHLWISYGSFDSDGNELRPSSIVDRIEEIFPNLEIEGDPTLSENISEYIGGPINTLRHFSSARRRERLGEEENPAWDVVEEWLKEEDEELLTRVSDALDFENINPPLSKDISEGLYSRYQDDEGNPIYRFSPTALETFSRCPFSYFIGQGLKAQELRKDEVGGREIGELYHSTLQTYTEKMDGESLWENITRKKSDELIENIAMEWKNGYRDNVFSKTNSERYRFDRAVEACKFVAWTLVEQVREGEIRESYYEVPFGSARSEAATSMPEGRSREGKAINLKPIVKELSGGGKAYIRGKIDRMDILEDDRVKIIDYKTGREAFDIEEAKRGYRLQLMLYLEAAQENKRKPAGVFYFLIKEPEVSLKEGKAGTPEEVLEDIKKSYRMDGIVLDDEKVIREIAGDFEKDSQVLKIKRKKDGEWDKNSEKRILSEEDFFELQRAVDEAATEIIEDITKGKIDLTIKVSGKAKPCRYCDYHGICRFDTVFSGCKYDVIK